MFNGVVIFDWFVSLKILSFGCLVWGLGCYCSSVFVIECVDYAIVIWIVVWFVFDC